MIALNSGLKSNPTIRSPREVSGSEQRAVVTWEADGEQYISVVSGWGGAVPLWGGEVAKKVNYLNQGGLVWVFKMPKELAAN